MTRPSLWIVLALAAAASGGATACSARDDHGSAATPADASTGGDDVSLPGPDGGGSLDATPDALVFPSPTGPYAVGTQQRVVVDTARTDPQAPDPATPRTLLVQLFYPADANAAATMPPYVRPLEAQQFENGSPALPAGWETHVVTHERDAVPVASGGATFPVVLFSHGLTALRPTYVTLIEDLVSHGFVVVAISHTYDSGVVVFPDGSAAALNTAWEGPTPADDAGAQAQEAYLEIYDRHLGVWVADARFVLDQVTQWAQGDALLGGRLDLARVGMFGHSYGGATAAEACALDPRFKAGINLDGTFFSPVRPDGGRAIPTPFMMQMNEQHGLGQTDDPTMKGTYDLLLDAGYAVTIAGSLHGTFWDMGLVFDFFDGPGTLSGFTGTIDHARALSIIDAYTLAFFQRHLEGMPAPLLDGPSPYPEVTYAHR
ncbi:MAG TPA: hypothetical protein VIF15_02700 [Polyangiaceae bacterium]